MSYSCFIILLLIILTRVSDALLLDSGAGSFQVHIWCPPTQDQLRNARIQNAQPHNTRANSCTLCPIQQYARHSESTVSIITRSGQSVSLAIHSPGLCVCNEPSTRIKIRIAVTTRGIQENPTRKIAFEITGVDLIYINNFV